MAARLPYNYPTLRERVDERQRVRTKTRDSALGFDMADLNAIGMHGGGDRQAIIQGKLAAMQKRQVGEMRNRAADSQAYSADLAQANDQATALDEEYNREQDRLRNTVGAKIPGTNAVVEARDLARPSGLPPPPVDPRDLVSQRGTYMDQLNAGTTPAQVAERERLAQQQAQERSMAQRTQYGLSPLANDPPPLSAGDVATMHPGGGGIPTDPRLTAAGFQASPSVPRRPARRSRTQTFDYR